MRVLFAMEVICFWHLQEYINISIGGLTHTIGAILTTMSLGGFTFLSGYCLRKYSFLSWSDVAGFYKKRFKRFYPLFFISATSLYIAGLVFGKNWFHGIGHYIMTLLGVTSIFPPGAGTIWYISMLILLYLITPLFRSLPKCKSILFCIMLYVVLWINNIISNGIFIDNNLLIYYPAYFFGLFWPQVKTLRINKIAGTVIFIATALLIFMVYKYTNVRIEQNIGFRVFFAIISVPIGIYIARGISHILSIRPTVEKMSYASMCAYLFHRQIYNGVSFVMGGGISVLIALIMAVLTFVIAYFLQKLYDFLMSN